MGFGFGGNNLLSGRRILVTGAAGGMGSEISKAVLAAGARLAVADLSDKALGELQRELADLSQTLKIDGGDVIALTGDLRDRSAVSQWADSLGSAWGAGPDGLVNCVGVFEITPTLEVRPEDWERVLGINLTGLFNACQIFGAAMVEGGFGTIVNIGSAAGLRGKEDRAAYVSSKHGVHGLTKSLAAEWGASGLRVNCIAPGRIETGMAADSFDDDARSEAWLKRTPMRRFGAPVEVAGPVLFLLSEMSSYVNGQEISVDGGYVSNF